MKLTHHTFGTGTVVSQDGDNITIDFNGVVKTIIIKYANLINEDGTLFGASALIPVAKKSKSQKRRQRDNEQLASFNAQPNLDKIMQSIMSINGKQQGDRHSLGYQIISERMDRIANVAVNKGETFVVDVINSVEKYMRASEKQAYVIAKFADDNGIQYE